MDKNLIIEKAREFIDTPYEHQGRLKGIGIDCCGLIMPGDILVFTIGKIPRHCGIVGSKDGNVTLIHAYSTIGRCVEHNLDKVWLDRIFQGFAFKSKDLYQTNVSSQS